MPESLRDAALQVFIIHFFSTDWLQEYFCERKFLIDDGEKHFQYETEKDLLYLVRLATDVYPTVNSIKAIMALFEEKNKEGLDISHFYFYGLVFDISKSHEKDEVVISICEKVLKLLPRRQHYFPFFGRLMISIEQKNADMEKVTYWSKLLSECASGKPQVNYHDAISMKLKERMKSEDDRYQSLLNQNNTENPSQKFAEKYMKKTFPITSTFDNSPIDTAKVLRKFKSCLGNYRVMMRVLRNWNKVDSFFIDKPDCLSMIQATCENLLSGDHIEMTVLINTKDKIHCLDQVLKKFVPELQGLFQALMYIPTGESVDQSRFNAAKLKCIHNFILPQLINNMTDYLANWNPPPQLLPGAFDTNPPLERSQTFNKYFQLFMLTEIRFHERMNLYYEYPILLDYLSIWHETFSKLFLKFLEEQLFLVTFGNDLFCQKKLEAHAEYLEQFDYMKYLNYFQYQLQQQKQQQSHSNNSKKGASNTKKDQRFLQSYLVIILQMIQNYHRVDGKETLIFVEKLTKIYLSLTSLDKEIQFARSLQEELISYAKKHPDEQRQIEKALAGPVEWDQRPAITSFLQSMVKYFEEIDELEFCNKYHLSRHTLLMEVFDSLRMDIIDLYQTNRTISRLLHSFDTQNEDNREETIQLKVPSNLLIYLLSQQKSFAKEVFQKVKEYTNSPENIWSHYTFPPMVPGIDINNDEEEEATVNYFYEEDIDDDTANKGRKLEEIHLPISVKYFRYFPSSHFPKFLKDQKHYFDYESGFELALTLARECPPLVPVLNRFLEIITRFLIDIDSVDRKRLVYYFNQMQRFLTILSIESARWNSEETTREILILNATTLLDCCLLCISIHNQMVLFSKVAEFWNYLSNVLEWESQIDQLVNPTFQISTIFPWNTAYAYALIIQRNLPDELKEKAIKKVYIERLDAVDDEVEDEVDEDEDDEDEDDYDYEKEDSCSKRFWTLFKLCEIAGIAALSGTSDKIKLYLEAIPFFEAKREDKMPSQLKKRSGYDENEEDHHTEKPVQSISLPGCFAVLRALLSELIQSVYGSDLELKSANPDPNILRDLEFAQECLHQAKQIVLLHQNREDHSNKNDFHLPEAYEKLFIKTFDHDTSRILFSNHTELPQSEAVKLSKVLNLFRYYNVFYSLSRPQEGQSICYHPCVISYLPVWEWRLINYETWGSSWRPLTPAQIESQFAILQEIESWSYYDLIDMTDKNTMTTYLLEGGITRKEEFAYMKGHRIPYSIDRSCLRQGHEDYEEACRLYLEWRELVEKEEKKGHSKHSSKQQHHSGKKSDNSKQKNQKVSGKTREKLEELYRAVNLMFLSFHYDSFCSQPWNMKYLKRALEEYQKDRQEIARSKNQGRIPEKKLHANNFT